MCQGPDRAEFGRAPPPERRSWRPRREPSSRRPTEVDVVSTRPTTVQAPATPAMRRRPPRRQQAADRQRCSSRCRAFIALIVIIIVFSLLSRHLPDLGQPDHDDQARRDQRDPRDRDAPGHPQRRHRPLGRLDRRPAGVVAGVLLEGLDLGFPSVIVVPAGLGRRDARRSLRRLPASGCQRHPHHPVQRRAVHRHAGHVVRRPRRRAADLQRRDLSPTSAAARRSATPGFDFLGSGAILGDPRSSIWLMVAVRRRRPCSLTRTPFGRWLYAIGGNERAAELAGVPVKQVKTPRLHASPACAPPWPA